MKRYVSPALFIASIVAANYAISHHAPIDVGFGLYAPAGVLFAGLTFTLRDFTQDAWGWRATALLVAIGAVISTQFGTDRVALASGVAFLVSELADLAVYTPLRDHGWIRAVVASNVVGFFIDSVLFLWVAFGSMQYLGGQLLGKAWMTVLAVALLAAVNAGRDSRREATA